MPKLLLRRSTFLWKLTKRRQRASLATFDVQKSSCRTEQCRQASSYAVRVSIRRNCIDCRMSSQQYLFSTSNKPQDDEDKDETSSSAVLDHWKEQLQSPPNIITLSRIASAPLLSYLIITNQHNAALAGCFLVGISDFLDGYLARHHNMSTVLGTYLDPLADKIIINTLAVSLWVNGTLPTPLVAVWMMKDLGLMVGTYFFVAKESSKTIKMWDPVTLPLKIEPTTTSKINTGLQFLTLGFGIIHPIYPVGDMLHVLCWITGATTCASGISYLGYKSITKAITARDGSKPKPKE